ncbi:MAG: Uma2 family endonuclease [Polyangiaceae bacterium]|nr:Uma2 family endonuclease [Polyangiaceae bacterium]
MAITEQPSPPHPELDDRRRYVRPPRPIHFPAFEEMPETNRHLELRTALYQILKRELGARATVGSEQFVYFDPTSAKKKLAPDAFVKLGPPHATFRVWKTWQRGAPDVAVEIVSDSDEGEEAWELKLERYRSAGIGEVVRFDPDDDEQPVRVWDHIDGDLVERTQPDDGVFECACLGLFWVVMPHPSFDRMLRLARDRAGRDRLPTPEEAEQMEARARQEEARARQEEARARQEAERSRDQLAAEVAELRRQLEERDRQGI